MSLVAGKEGASAKHTAQAKVDFMTRCRAPIAQLSSLHRVPRASLSDQMDEARALLRDVWGYDGFRGVQEDVRVPANVNASAD